MDDAEFEQMVEAFIARPAVKVVDILGNDTMTIVDVQV